MRRFRILITVQCGALGLGKNNNIVNRSVGIQPTSSGNYGESRRASDHVTKESGERELERAEIRPLKEIEREAILVAVKQLGVSGAASVLGVGRTTIHRKLRSYQAGSPEPEPGWRAVPVTKVNALLAAAAKAAEFLRWCRGTMAPRLVSGWMQPFRTFRKWQYPDVIPSVTKLLVVPLNEVANQRQEARHRLILVDEAVHIPHGFRWLPRVQDDRHIALDFLHLLRKKSASCSPQHVIGQDETDRSITKNFRCLCAGARTENGITSLLQHGLPRTQIDLVVFYAENQGLARDCGRRSGHLQGKAIESFQTA